jgi:hypothetical protein
MIIHRYKFFPELRLHTRFSNLQGIATMQGTTSMYNWAEGKRASKEMASVIEKVEMERLFGYV